MYSRCTPALVDQTKMYPPCQEKAWVRVVYPWVGAWDHVEVKMATSKGLISAASPFALVRARGGSQGPSPLHFDDEQGSRVACKAGAVDGLAAGRKTCFIRRLKEQDKSRQLKCGRARDSGHGKASSKLPVRVSYKQISI